MTEAISTTAFAGKTVLLIDDDDFIVDVVRQSVGPVVSALEVAKDGVDALEILKKRTLTSCFSTSDAAHERRPLINHLRFDLISWTHDRHNRQPSNTVRAFISDNGCMYLPRPFNVRELYGAMTALVHGSGRKAAGAA